MSSGSGLTARTSEYHRTACSAVQGTHSSIAARSSPASAARKASRTACHRRLRAKAATQATTATPTAMRAARSRCRRREVTPPIYFFPVYRASVDCPACGRSDGLRSACSTFGAGAGAGRGSAGRCAGAAGRTGWAAGACGLGIGKNPRNPCLAPGLEGSARAG